MKYTCVIFDLDGTLLDTLDDLTDSVNMALGAFGFPRRTKEQVREFVGNGVARLVALAVPTGTPKEVELACLDKFKEIYAQNCTNQTRPYAYVPEMLTHLRAMGVKVGIVSNKFDGAVKMLAKQYFDGMVDVAVGERESQGVRKKPCPDTVFEAMAQMRADPTATAYVGDSEVDILTAQNAGMPCLSVSWGFRTREQLIDAGADLLFEDAQALEGYLL